MKIDFVQEIIEDEYEPRIVGCLTGWEWIVFEVEDEGDGSPVSSTEGTGCRGS